MSWQIPLPLKLRLLHRSEKSPWRSWSVGTVVLNGVPVRKRNPS